MWDLMALRDKLLKACVIFSQGCANRLRNDVFGAKQVSWNLCSLNRRSFKDRMKWRRYFTQFNFLSPCKEAKAKSKTSFHLNTKLKQHCGGIVHGWYNTWELLELLVSVWMLCGGGGVLCCYPSQFESLPVTRQIRVGAKNKEATSLAAATCFQFPVL